MQKKLQGHVCRHPQAPLWGGTNLQLTISRMPHMCHTLGAKLLRSSFDGREHDREYLSLQRGQMVRWLGRSEAGWSFGELEGDVNCSGWFPSDFVALADSTGSLEVPALSLNATSEVLEDLDTDTHLLVSSTLTHRRGQRRLRPRDRTSKNEYQRNRQMHLSRRLEL